MKPPEIRIAGDSALLVDFGSKISPVNSRRVAALAARLAQSSPIPNVVHVQPAYSSVLVRFDVRRTDHEAVEARLREILTKEEGRSLSPERVREIPVCYGGEFGPDLGDVADAAGLSPAAAAAVHAEAEYTVCFFGFMPGFAYLSGLPAPLAVPRLSVPRGTVPAGSVGIAGPQTGVYPVSSPGGWRLIGRTPLPLFDPAREPMSYLSLGDRVRFKSIPPERFKALCPR
ncbi:MAG: 5-oxoprolinase subunit PxpB [Elusimicrobiota bacterium]